MKSNGTYTGGEGYDRIFRALGDPHRIQIIRLLKEKELSAGEILSAVDVVQSTLSHHMKTLSESGVVNAIRQGKWTYYSLNEATLADAAVFLEEYAKGTAKRKIWKKPQPSAGQADTNPVKEPEGRSDMAEPPAEAPVSSTAPVPSADSVPSEVTVPSEQLLQSDTALSSSRESSNSKVPENRKKKDKDKEKKGKKNKKNKK